MSLATSKNNKPWVCEVHFAYDDDLNLYFVSATSTRHATEAVENPYVSGNIVTQHYKNQKVRCVDFEGTVEILTHVEANDPGLKVYTERFESTGLLEEINKDGETALFKITVKDFFVFDSYGDARGKFHLVWEGGKK